MSDRPQNAAKVFLSYSRRDGAAADRVFDALMDAGLEVLRDAKDILPAEDWRGRLEGLITASDAIVFLMSPDSVRSEVCSWEIETGHALNKRIVPVVIGAVDEAIVPPEIARLNYVFARAGDDFGAAMQTVAAAVATDIGWVREHTRLYERAAEWEREGGRAHLLRGDPLARAEAWLAAEPASGPAPLALHRSWIAASRQGAVARQRWWVTGSLGVAAVSIGLGIFAEVNRRIAAEQRDRAERILDRGSQTANDLVFDLALRFRDREGIPQDLVFDILGRSKGLVDLLAQAGEDRPDLIRSRAAALTELSLTLLRQEDLDAARASAEEALEGFRRVAGQPGVTDRAVLDLAVAHDRLGDVHFAAGDLDAADAAFRASLDLNAGLAGAPQPPADARANLAVAHEKLGTVALARGDGAAALAAFRAARTAQPDDRAAGRTRAILLERTGDSHLLLGALDDGARAYGESLALTERLAEADPADTVLQRDLAVIHQKLGDLALETGATETALSHFREDLEITERLAASDPERLDWRGDLVVSHDRLGVVLYQLDRGEDAATAFRAAWQTAMGRAELRPGRADLIGEASKAAQKLALVSFANGDPGESFETVSMDMRLLADFHDRTGEAGAALADALNNVAWYGLFTDETDLAVEAARAALEIDPENLPYSLNLAHALMLAGDGPGARGLHEANLGKDAGGSTWAEMVRADFDVLRGEGIETPLMAGIEALLEGEQD